jgi:hypothetical protein
MRVVRHEKGLGISNQDRLMYESDSVQKELYLHAAMVSVLSPADPLAQVVQRDPGVA